MFFYKFHHLQVSNGTKNGTFGFMSQVEKLGLVGYQNFLEWLLMAHLKTFAHIYVLFMNSTIRKWDIALKTTLLVPPLKWKILKVQDSIIVIIMVRNP